MTANANALTRESGSIKKMIRDTTRLLNRPNLPADLRREQERKLAALQVALTDRQKAEVEREMVVKYRMVKFFERKKALRRLAAAQASGNSEAVREAQLDLAYILHFPKDRKYISLYPASGVEVSAERDVIRKQISEKLAALGAEVLLAKAMGSGSKKVKAALKDAEDESDSDDDDDSLGSEGSEDDSDDVSDSKGSDDSDNESDSDDGLSYDEDSDDLDSDEDGSDDDDSDDLDSEDGSDDEDDEDSDDDDSDSEEEDSDEESDGDDSEEDGSEEEDSDDESDEDAPKAKKSRR